MIAQQRDFLDTMYENRFEPVEESNTLASYVDSYLHYLLEYPLLPGHTLIALS